MRRRVLLFLVSLAVVPSIGAAVDDFRPKAEAELTSQVRQEQQEYYQQRASDVVRGLPDEVAEDACEYVSGIFQPPPLNVVYLTFDDGPNSRSTPFILRVLEKYGIKATFFMIGEYAKSHPEVVRQVIGAGHLIGNHSWSHPDFHKFESDKLVSELSTADAYLKPVLGTNKLFRYPYGNSTCFGNSFVHQQLGYSGIVGWHVDSCDWAFEKTGTVPDRDARSCEVAPQNVSNFAGHVLSATHRHHGGIILFHSEMYSHSALSLEEIIVRLRKDGFAFGTLDDPRVSKYYR